MFFFFKDFNKTTGLFLGGKRLHYIFMTWFYLEVEGMLMGLQWSEKAVDQRQQCETVVVCEWHCWIFLRRRFPAMRRQNISSFSVSCDCADWKTNFKPKQDVNQTVSSPFHRQYWQLNLKKHRTWRNVKAAVSVNIFLTNFLSVVCVSTLLSIRHHVSSGNHHTQQQNSDRTASL